jgi:hypothetical protein
MLASLLHPERKPHSELRLPSPASTFLPLWEEFGVPRRTGLISQLVHGGGTGTDGVMEFRRL